MKSRNQFRGLQQHLVLPFYMSCNKALGLGGFRISVTKLTDFIIGRGFASTQPCAHRLPGSSSPVGLLRPGLWATLGTLG